MRRHELTDGEWARIQPHLPLQKAGARRKDDRLVINAILFKLATGVPWRDLPERYGPWQSIYTRFRRWTEARVWDHLFAAIQREADATGQIDWDVHFVDGTVIRAHQHAAGAKGGTQRRRRWGAARAASRPRSTCARTVRASR
jgi:transposase